VKRRSVGELLRTLREDADARAREDAVRALGRIRAPEVAPALAEALRADGDAAVRGPPLGPWRASGDARPYLPSPGPSGRTPGGPSGRRPPTPWGASAVPKPSGNSCGPSGRTGTPSSGHPPPEP